MPIPWNGNTSSEAMSSQYNLPFRIVFFTVANKNAGDTTINIAITDGVNTISIVPQNLVLSEGDMLEGDYLQVFEAMSQIKITVSASVDYYFTLENITPT